MTGLQPESYLVVGLGNPGPEYAMTRHNLGFIVIDALAKDHSLQWTLDKAHSAYTARGKAFGRSIILAKPQTFMNLSGQSVRSLSQYYKIPSEHIIILHDDITLAVGDFKITCTGSSGGHNGVADILSKITPNFIRFKLGIGPKTHPLMSLSDHVLGKIPQADLESLNSKIKKFVDGLNLVVDKGHIYAMNVLHSER